MSWSLLSARVAVYARTGKGSGNVLGAFLFGRSFQVSRQARAKPRTLEQIEELLEVTLLCSARHVGGMGCPRQPRGNEVGARWSWWLQVRNPMPCEDAQRNVHASRFMPDPGLDRGRSGVRPVFHGSRGTAGPPFYTPEGRPLMPEPTAVHRCHARTVHSSAEFDAPSTRCAM